MLSVAHLKLTNPSTKAFVNILHRIHLHLSVQGTDQDARRELYLVQRVKLLKLLLMFVNRSDWSGDSVFVLGKRNQLEVLGGKISHFVLDALRFIKVCLHSLLLNCCVLFDKLFDFTKFV